MEQIDLMNQILENIRNDYYQNHRHGEELLTIDLESVYNHFQAEIDDLKLQLENLQVEYDEC